MKKLFLLAILNLCIHVVYSQEYAVGRYYASQGESWTEWKNVCVGYDYYGNPVMKRHCRQTNWYSEYRSGYYYAWDGYRWVKQWYEGSQWYCTWSRWYIC